MSNPPQTKRDPISLEDLPFFLARAAVAFRKLNDCTLREVGMKSQQLGAGTVLHHLFEDGSCTVKELSKRTHLPNGTLTGVLDGLERQTLICRVKNAADGRSWLVQLTREGRLKRETVIRRHKIIMELFGKVLAPEESALLKNTLGRLTKAMHEHVAASRSDIAKSGPKKRASRRA